MNPKRSQNKLSTLRWVLTNGPAIITVLGSSVLAVLASVISFTTIQFLQSILTLLALIGTSLLTERLVEGRQLQAHMKEIDLRLNDVLDYARDIKAAGLDSLIRERRDLPPLEERLDGAKHISILGVSLYRLAYEYKSLFEKLTKEGCKFRFLLTDPESDAAAQLSSTVVYESIDADAYRGQMNNSLTSLTQLVESYPDNCELKLYSFAPPFSIMIIEKSSGISVVQVEIYAFRIPARNRLMMILDKVREPGLYSFFSLQFDSIWGSEFSKNIPDSSD
jgi:hypothetical protein